VTHERRRCVCLVGPTACGKTDLALSVAERLPVEIVSMDSAMVYRALDIGTAKPPRDVRARIPHHLVDILDPSEAYSAGSFARDARAAIDDIAGRGRLPLIVGGTLLYLRALRDGLAELPRANAAVRAELDEQAVAMGWAAMHERLRTVDPDAAARIAPEDRQRIQRALEIHALTGQPMTELQRRGPRESMDLEIATVAIAPAARAELGGRIERRFDDMVRLGFVEEVASLRSRGDLTLDLPALRAVGYRQIWLHLDGAFDWPEARRRALVATGQLAKRQLTWIRSDRFSEQWPSFAPGLASRFLSWVERSIADAT
jgi:tRNA dimethylallyltransferase